MGVREAKRFELAAKIGNELELLSEDRSCTPQLLLV